MSMKIQDTFYISHGPPSLCLEEQCIPLVHFLQSFQQKVHPIRPSSILLISGHFETSYPTVNAVSNGPSDTIYDFEGFPECLNELKYPAPGAPELAKRVKELLMASGFERVDEDENRGLDHGAWSPLRLMYPEADIPVCQLSIQTDKDATYHYNMGKALAPLKNEGVLIVGSGGTTHNLEEVRFDTTLVQPWAQEFDTWLKEALVDGRYEDVNKYKEKAPHATMVHPTPDHFYPLHVAMGAADANSKGQLIHHSWGWSSLSYATYKFMVPLN
ncbi:putative stizolobate synthase [Helianthus annuus]|uniref:Putative extradiol ring-cleavage dioxygenase, class III enzyme, subunit B n=1 Tax=Helianthus annuus TaxID=4232 RepID=A0A251TGA3_HELAN|nr:extradiol ring-cleavage dioxygenase [Helianthus annuus]KAF5771613.1 putative stizolobate synthase [Helianthus annuus]KAJ0475379.1 putative stizolobate synthase [Helianthus annuus]KAJ0479242.1 putative stizolobate synthase [Helianthus annuus]KAJ0496182.1 putative stizolobate synthase [Helianthus annuus]KAJ0662256.1 putative stizolobate synthase [Helianthus annuus]